MCRLLFFILILAVLSMLSIVNAEDVYCYQKPDSCPAGAALILSLSEDVAKYCDFDKQIISVERRTSSSSFNNQEVVCVKTVAPRKKLK
jgi:hypothetical protein